MSADFTDIDGVENTYDDRPTRPCMACGQKDKAPRDVVALSDGNVVLYHKDCHAMLGCVTCKKELDQVANGSGSKSLKNEDLWVAIVEQGMIAPESERPEIYTTLDASGEFEKFATPEELKAFKALNAKVAQ